MSALQVLFIDNLDSFSFNLVDEFARRGCRVDVWRHDLAAEQALALALALPAPRLLVISPGPGAPGQAGCIVPLIRLAAGKLPVFGVCLGHQALVEAMGGQVAGAGRIIHGKSSRIAHDGQGLFAGLPSPLMAGRYHSLAATVVPPELAITARCGETVMAVEHRRYPLAGVQFHPESILTPMGGRIIDNVIQWAAAAPPARVVAA